jgi:uncharacterized protein YndB with AHSA1/START domain
MTSRSVTHAMFTLERTYPHPPAKVFHAFADEKAKAMWFKGPPDWIQGERSFDFRVGGKEVDVGGPPDGGPMHRCDIVYQDIVPNERIIYTYGMELGDVRISVSLTTVEITQTAGGARLRLTEHGAYLDGYDDSGAREEGTGELLDALGRALDELA